MFRNLRDFCNGGHAGVNSVTTALLFFWGLSRLSSPTSLPSCVFFLFFFNVCDSFFRYWQYRYDSFNKVFVIEKTARPIWEYGLPSALNDMDAAFVYTNNRIYFFKAHQYWRYNEYWRRVDAGYPRNTSQGWTNLTGPLDAAMTWGSNRRSYFFKGEDYLGIEKTAHRVESGYPQNIALKWMKCDPRSLEWNSP